MEKILSLTNYRIIRGSVNPTSPTIYTDALFSNDFDSIKGNYFLIKSLFLQPTLTGGNTAVIEQAFDNTAGTANANSRYLITKTDAVSNFEQPIEPYSLEIVLSLILGVNGRTYLTASFPVETINQIFKDIYVYVPEKLTENFTLKARGTFFDKIATSLNIGVYICITGWTLTQEQLDEIKVYGIKKPERFAEPSINNLRYLNTDILK